MATMSYLTDVTSAGGRTTRVMVLEAMTFLGGTLGPLLAGLLLPLTGRASVFALIVVCHLLVIAYVAFILPQVRRNPEEAETAKGHGMISWYHMRQSLASCFRPREDGRRARLLLYFASMVVIIIAANGEMDIAYLFLKDKPLEWDSSHFSYFIAAKYGMGSALLLLGGPLSVRVCSATDTSLTQLGLLSRAAGLILLGASTTDLMVWLGKVFSCMSMLENVCLLLGSLIFNSLYPAMRELGHSGYTFYVAALMLVLPAAFFWIASRKQLGRPPTGT
ncbi:hypothetical protein B566_EDAN011443 [Ephemera danica]|nr:hypothetical protein B566_EDAN011443 [Ephemera danica]